MAVPAARQAEQLGEPVERPSARARSRPASASQAIAFTFSAAVSSSARIPGSEPVIAKYAKKRGWFQCVSARHDQLVEVAQHVGERLGLLGRRRRQPRAELARAATCAQRPAARRRARGSAATQSSAPAPGRRGSRSSAAASAAARAASRCACSATSSFVSQARRACADAELDVVERRRPGARRSRSRASGPPRARRARGRRVRSSRSGCELISRNVPVSSASSITRSTSTSRGGRLPILRPVEVADAVDVRVLHRREHALGRVVSKRECTEATTQSSVREVVVGHVERRRSRGCSPRPLRGAGAARRARRSASISSSCCSQPALAQAVRVVADRVVLVAARAAPPRPSPRACPCRRDQVVCVCRSPRRSRSSTSSGSSPRARGLELAARSRAARAGSARSRGTRRPRPRRANCVHLAALDLRDRRTPRSRARAAPPPRAARRCGPSSR